MLTNSVATLVSQEVEHLVLADIAISTTIESLEGGIWCKVADSAKSLASYFESLFSITDRDKEVFETVLRFVSEHCSETLKKRGYLF